MAGQNNKLAFADTSHDRKKTRIMMEPMLTDLSALSRRKSS